MSKAKTSVLIKPETSTAVVEAGDTQGHAATGTDKAEVATTEAAPEAAPLPRRIEPTEANPEPAPPCGGSWMREEDGGLAPRDEATARGAGLAWPA